MKLQRPGKSRGHGGAVFVRGLHEALADSRRRKIEKKIARLLAHPHSLTAADRAWIAKHQRRATAENAKRVVSRLDPVETLNG